MATDTLKEYCIKSFYTLWHWLLHVSAIQLFLTLISLPVLVGWGLPLSYITPFGTLLFTPILTVYLWCALAVFFTTLLHIPNGICIKLLALVSDWWLWILAGIKKPLVLGFVNPPLIVLCLIPVSAFGIVWFLHRRRLWIIVLALAGVLCGWIGLLRTFVREEYVQVLHDGSKELVAYRYDNVLTVVDVNSCCSAMTDGASWILYTAMPVITQKTGATHIDRFIVFHPRQRTFEALISLCRKGIVADVYVPYWEGHIPQSAFYAYKRLKRTLEAYGYHVYVLQTRNALQLDAHTVVQKTDAQEKYGDATYPLFAIHYINDNV